jgi:hypothetical protein
MREKYKVLFFSNRKKIRLPLMEMFLLPLVAFVFSSCHHWQGGKEATQNELIRITSRTIPIGKKKKESSTN